MTQTDPEGKTGFFQEVLDNLFDGVYFVDRQRNISYWNKGAERISGYSSQDVLGKSCAENILMDTDESGTALRDTDGLLSETIDDGQPREAETYLRHKDGHSVPVLIRAMPILDEQGKINGAVEIFIDNASMVAARRRTSELQHKADSDPLTGVGNRLFSEVKFQAALKAYQQYGELFGLLFIDVDRFRQINESFGHTSGDQMLKLVADTLRYSVRTTDFVGRWGGEEFIVLLYETSEQQIAAISNKLRLLVEKTNLITDRGEAQVTISIGATIIQPGDSFKSILERAGKLLNESKASGGNKVTAG